MHNRLLQVSYFFKISFHPNGDEDEEDEQQGELGGDEDDEDDDDDDDDDEDDYPDGEEDEDDEQERELRRDDIPVCYSSPVQCSWYNAVVHCFSEQRREKRNSELIFWIFSYASSSTLYPCESVSHSFKLA